MSIVSASTYKSVVDVIANFEFDEHIDDERYRAGMDDARAQLMRQFEGAE